MPRQSPTCIESVPALRVRRAFQVFRVLCFFGFENRKGDLIDHSSQIALSTMNTWNTFDRTQPLANPPRCVLENVSWEEVIGRDNIQAFSPFSGVAIGASNGCHLCSLLYGALKTFDPFEGCTRLRSDCSCLSRANIPFHLAGRDNYVVVDVDCTSLSGANHRAILQLSTLPHNRGSASISWLESWSWC